MSDGWPASMEVADNQHPIDLSPKCRYYDESRPCIKSAVSSSRPLPDLIPIRILQDAASPPAHSGGGGGPFAAFSSSSASPFSATSSTAFSSSAASSSSFSSKRDRQLLECFRSCNQSLMGLQVKDRSRDRKESSRFRGSPLGSSSLMSSPTSPSSSPFSSSSPSSSSSNSHASPFSAATYGSKMRKSKSDTRISTPACLGHAEYTFGTRIAAPANHLNVVPMNRNIAITRSDGIGKYAAERDRAYHDSSCFLESKRERRSDEDEISSSVFHSNSNKYLRQGPGVSLSTIQSLRKLLDKRKSMQKDG